MIHHLDFLIWMLGFPVADAVSDWIIAKAKNKKPRGELDGYQSTAILLIWFGVGYLLY